MRHKATNYKIYVHSDIRTLLDLGAKLPAKIEIKRQERKLHNSYLSLDHGK
jgi:hypothetical protein